jgi:hypothetical protein
MKVIFPKSGLRRLRSTPCTAWGVKAVLPEDSTRDVLYPGV